MQALIWFRPYIVLSFKLFPWVFLIWCFNIHSHFPCDCTFNDKWILVGNLARHKAWPRFHVFHRFRSLQTLRWMLFWVYLFRLFVLVIIYEMYCIKATHGLLGFGHWILEGLYVWMVKFFECFDDMWNFFKLFFVFPWDHSNSGFMLGLSNTGEACWILGIEIWLGFHYCSSVSALIFIILRYCTHFLLLLNEW